MAKKITISYEIETGITRTSDPNYILDHGTTRTGRRFRRVPDRRTRVALRRVAGVGHRRHPPVVVVPGRSAPRLLGEPGYRTWTPNPNGTRVWSKNGGGHYTYYHCSTERVEVGQRWLDRRAA